MYIYQISVGLIALNYPINFIKNKLRRFVLNRMDILGMNCINVDKNSNYLIFQERIGLDQILWGLFKSGQNLHSTKTPLT